MPDEEWVRQLAGLVVLACCAAMAAPPPIPEQKTLPAVEAAREEKRPGRGTLPPEAQEFMRLPPHIRKQVLGYARNWLDSNFEKAE